MRTDRDAQVGCPIQINGWFSLRHYADASLELEPGMYSRSAWGGPVDPYINVMFLPKEAPADQDPIVSLVIFEWKDEDLIGVRETPDAENVSRTPVNGFGLPTTDN